MSHVVVISGHPQLQQSHTNRVILDRLSDGLISVDIRKLDSLYPDYQIDVEAEQQALLAADVIVLQFPFYWYSMPALMKKWMDDVFSFNFAYGSKGDKLKGKQLLLSFTVGGPAESYDPLGYNHFTIEQLLYPLQQTAYLAGMVYNPPIYSNGMVYIPEVYNTLEGVQAKAHQHADRLLARIDDLLGNHDAKLKQFAKQWFELLDKLPEQSQWFTDHIASDAAFITPDGGFTGPQGFRDWYGVLRQQFKPDCQHTIEQLELHPQDDGYRMDLRIRLLADTFEHSPWQGKPLNLLVNEHWLLKVIDGDIKIQRYDVVPVQS